MMGLASRSGPLSAHGRTSTSENATRILGTARTGPNRRGESMLVVEEVNLFAGGDPAHL